MAFLLRATVCQGTLGCRGHPTGTHKERCRVPLRVSQNHPVHFLNFIPNKVNSKVRHGQKATKVTWHAQCLCPTANRWKLGVLIPGNVENWGRNPLWYTIDMEFRFLSSPEDPGSCVCVNTRHFWSEYANKYSQSSRVKGMITEALPDLVNLNRRRRPLAPRRRNTLCVVRVGKG